jgi:geranylgeranyl diphosphate synthase type I
MAVGQYLGLAASGGAADGPEAAARRAAALKGGGYTVEGPLLIGAALADASSALRGCLARFGRPLGEAFQLRDDLQDGDAAPGVTRDTVDALVAEANASLDPSVVTEQAAAALRRIADEVAR